AIGIERQEIGGAHVLCMLERPTGQPYCRERQRLHDCVDRHAKPPCKARRYEPGGTAYDESEELEPRELHETGTRPTIAASDQPRSPGILQEITPTLSATRR